MELDKEFKKFKEFIKINKDLCGIMLLTAQFPILEECLKLYLQTDKGEQALNLQNKKGKTPLMIASKYSNTQSTIETVKILIDNGADINLQDENGFTALMNASQCSNSSSSIDTVKLLIESGANINLQDYNSRWTILMCACFYLTTNSTVFI